MKCKYCGWESFCKNGFVRGLQRYFSKKYKGNSTTFKTAGYPLENLKGLGSPAMALLTK